MTPEQLKEMDALKKQVEKLELADALNNDIFDAMQKQITDMSVGSKALLETVRCLKTRLDLLDGSGDPLDDLLKKYPPEEKTK